MYKIPANTLFIGKNLVFVPECHSTNDLALQISRESTTHEGTVVITNSQTSGRGQRGNSWESTKDMNFTLSVILKPGGLAIEDQFYLNIFTSLAIVDYLKEKISNPIKIKWPNDVFVNGKKLGGILIENQISNGRFTNSVVGIGLNVNQKNFTISTATSMSSVAGKDFELAVEYEQLLKKLELRYLQLRQLQLTSLAKDYVEQLYWLHENHVFSSQGIEFEGEIIGIDKAGKLVIRSGQQRRSFDLKEVIYIR